MTAPVKVFLGGTCNDSTWREEMIDHLCDLGLTWFDPVVDDWSEIAQKREVYEKSICDFHLYTITPKMIGVFAIAEVVDDSHKMPGGTVLVLLEKDEGLAFSPAQWKSLHAVARLIKQNGAKVFFSLEDTAKWMKLYSDFDPV